MITGPEGHSRMLDGKVAVITGAGQGIGKACAAVFVREGAKVLAVDFSGKQDQTAQELGPSVIPFHADVREEAEVEAIYAACLDAFGGLDASIHVAGTQATRQQDEFTLDEYEEMTATNLRGLLLCCKYASRYMEETGGGSIVNFTSVAAINCETLAPLSYTAAKSAVHGVSKVLASDNARKGIRVNVVAPGFTMTEVLEGISPEILEHMSAKPMLGRPARGEEQGEVAAFLASDRSSYITGAVIPVDGGWTARLV